MVFELPVSDGGMLCDLEELEMLRAEARRKEALEVFYTLRKDVGDLFSELDLVVLQPYCISCAEQRSGGTNSGGDPAIIFVLPGYRPQQFRMYDVTNHELHFFPYERGENEERFRIVCSHCGDYADLGSDDGNEVIHVEAESFCDYFGVEDEGAEKPDGDLREEIRALYGHVCFKCGSKEHLTVDHIVPKSAGGLGVPTNLQLLCEKCNAEKADKFPEKLILALDFLMRPAPWDSYEGLIW